MVDVSSSLSAAFRGPVCFPQATQEQLIHSHVDNAATAPCRPGIKSQLGPDSTSKGILFFKEHLILKWNKKFPFKTWESHRDKRINDELQKTSNMAARGWRHLKAFYLTEHRGGCVTLASSDRCTFLRIGLPVESDVGFSTPLIYTRTNRHEFHEDDCSPTGVHSFQGNVLDILAQN